MVKRRVIAASVAATALVVTSAFVVEHVRAGSYSQYLAAPASGGWPLVDVINTESSDVLTAEATVSQFPVVVPDEVIDVIDPTSPDPGSDADGVIRVPDVLSERPEVSGAIDEVATGDGDDVTLDVVDDSARAASAIIQVDEPFSSLGFTWPTGQSATPALQVRVRGLDGNWGGWFPLEVSDAEPDEAAVPDGTQMRSGTDPVWVGEADAVQIASIGAAGDAVPVSDVRLVTVAAPSSSNIADSAVVAPAVYHSGAMTEQAAWDGPAVVTRAQWGARPARCSWGTSSKLQAAVVHHTAGQAGYTTQAQAMAQLRADQAYHMDARGWCDLGYNFVVDKFGSIYEGAADSMTRAVIGAHAAPFNTGTVGISIIGCYGECASGNAALTDAAVNAVGRIAGYRLGSYGVNPDSTIIFDNGQQRRTMPAIVGHRDVNSTACPGSNAYGRLGEIRKVAAANASTRASYIAHAADLGWLNWQTQGQTAGTTGQARPAEALMVNLVGVPVGSGVECQAHSKIIGWQPWVTQGATCGTTGRGLQLEAFRLRLTGPIAATHRIWYNAHVAGLGWIGWSSDGMTAGTTGHGLRLEALQIVVQPAAVPAPGALAGVRPIEYRAHAAIVGWMAPVRDGATAGTTGQARRLEALTVGFPEGQLWDGAIECSAHVANIGWLDWVADGATCGTTGRALQLEAIKLRLIGDAATSMDVWYRVHSADVGWSGWARNGDPAGTQGFAYRAEAVEIRYLPRGASAPGPTSNAMRMR